MLPRVERHLSELRTQDAEAARRRAGSAPDLDPGLAARAPHRTAYRGLEVLAVHLEARRGLLFDRFVEFWAEQERKRTWERLEEAADAHRDRAKERRRATERARRAREELERAERLEREAAAAARRAAERLAGAQPVEPVPAPQSPPDGKRGATAGEPVIERGPDRPPPAPGL
jgi:hypothetical protein